MKVSDGLYLLSSRLMVYCIAVRRAYRQAALRTHPDKQPQGASEKEMQRARDKFEKVCS